MSRSCAMSMRSIRVVATIAILSIASLTVRAAEPLPPAPGLSESAATERAALFRALAGAKSEAEGRAAEDPIWLFWIGQGDRESQGLLDEAKRAQRVFDNEKALGILRTLVEKSPRYAEAWNQLGFTLFLSLKFDDSLRAIERTLELEPLHFGALAGKGLILTQQGKTAEAQAALKKAVAIHPWLKERDMIIAEPGRKI